MNLNCSRFFFIIMLLAGPVLAGDSPVKQPDVAGGFYERDPETLSRHIDQLMTSAGDVPDDQPVEIAIAPHAGYIYSGPVAAHTFKAIAKNKYSTIIIIAPSHFYPFDGAAIWPKGGFQTPLGVVPVDEDFSRALLNKTPVVKELSAVFNQEHALEVELPFVQKTFGNVKIVPLLMGQPNFKMCEDLALALNQLIGDRHDILVLISSDMSHYHPYDAANAMDARTLEAIRHEDVEGFWNGVVGGTMEMCGFVPVTVGMMLAQLRGLSTAEVLKYANSGDTAGEKTKVVGYGSVIFYRPSAELTPAQKKYLLTLARQTIKAFVETGQKQDVNPADGRLNQVQGAFVTIKKKGELRGCIGDIIGKEPLVLTVRDMAIAAASKDPRFSPVAKDELKDIEVEISVSSPPKRIKDASEIILGRDGVIISDGGEHQGVFLPQVASETGWSKEEFLSQLCAQKAGLAPNAWKDPNIMLYTFTAEVFGEEKRR